MPRGVRDMNSLKGIESRIGSIDAKKASLLAEIAELDEERSGLIDKKKAILKERIVDKILASGKSEEEILQALGM